MSLNDDIIPEYKQDIPETPSRILLHYSTFKTSWDWLIIILTLYTTVSVPFIVCFEYNPSFLTVIDMLVDWLFIADIVLNFHTTYVGKDGELIDDPKMIRMNYLKTWFVLDLVSSLPYGILFYVINDAEPVSGFHCWRILLFLIRCMPLSLMTADSFIHI